MKITDIKQQVKRQGRYSIFVDGKYTFSLSENELVKSGIKIGRDYAEIEFQELKNTAVIDKAYMRSLDLLSRRARSEWEIRDYLKRKDYESDVVEEIISRLNKAGYINDLAFAKSWIASRRLLKSSSKRKLSMELKQKGLKEEIINQALAEDEANELEVLKELVVRKRNQTRYQDQQKLMQYLSRQGFNYDDIKAVLGQMAS